MKIKDFVKKRAFRDFGIVLVALAAGTMVFWVTDLDILASRWFFSPGGGWSLAGMPVWDFIYRFGIFPGYLYAIASLLLISLSYWSARFSRFRKAALVMVFTMILGPGLLVNLVMKDHWGRPRPREIMEFGGKEKYLDVLVIGKTNEGKSFPCGHASMGFYMAIPYLFFRRRRKWLAWAFMATGTAWGFVIGFARMMAGGHFLSDVIWAGGIVWIAGLAGFYIFRPDKPAAISLTADPASKRKARLATFIVGILLPLITFGLVLATPYMSKKSLTVGLSDLKRQKTAAILADLKDATVEISVDTCFQSAYEVNAFGFPNSKVRGNFTPGDTARYTISYMGWFTEFRNRIFMKLPMGESCYYDVKVRKGKIFCTLSDGIAASFGLTVERGDIFLKLNKSHVVLLGDQEKVVNRSGRPVEIRPAGATQPGGSGVGFRVPAGKIYIEQ